MAVESTSLSTKWQPAELRNPLAAINAGSFEPLAAGQKSSRVKLVQEWLDLQGYGVNADRDFGPATTAAVGAYQQGAGLPQTGVVDGPTFQALTRPMVEALQPINPTPQDLSSAIVAYARQHVDQRSRELGNQNLGPWVRLYMNGQEGRDQLWCAGFACFVLRQASQALSQAMPIQRSVSCDVLAERAKNRGTFTAHNKRQAGEPAPGWLFLVRKSPGDWTHVGLVSGTKDDVFWTVEGNTNDEGSRNGYEVCTRIRRLTPKIDFIRIG